MALGDKTDTLLSNKSYIIELLASANAANGIPSSASAGIDMNLFSRHSGRIPDMMRIGVRSTAGSGTMTVACRLWQYSGELWFVAQPLAADPATPYTAGTIPESSNDAINYSEPVFGLAGASRLYLEIVAIAGTGTAVTGYAIVG